MKAINGKPFGKPFGKPAVPLALACALLAGIAGCGDKADGNSVAQNGVMQTGFPGQVSAGGGTSGDVMSRSPHASQQAAMPSGTPGIPKGAEGNTSGPALGGSTGETPSAGGAKPGSNSK